jgi:nuclear polyadenylated RNA-binding protein NAB2
VGSAVALCRCALPVLRLAALAAMAFVTEAYWAVLTFTTRLMRRRGSTAAHKDIPKQHNFAATWPLAQPSHLLPTRGDIISRTSQHRHARFHPITGLAPHSRRAHATMAGLQVESGSAQAHQIQLAAQQKLMELGWAPEESDTTLSEYVTMMLVNGKEPSSVQAELGGELLGVGEDDPGAAEFTRWLFQHAQSIVGGGHNQHPQTSRQQERDLGATTVQPQRQTDEQPAGTAAEDQAMGDVSAPGIDGAYVLPSWSAPNAIPGLYDPAVRSAREAPSDEPFYGGDGGWPDQAPWGEARVHEPYSHDASREDDGVCEPPSHASSPGVEIKGAAALHRPVRPYADLRRPSGPKAMRNGSDAARGRGRGGRMLGQMNRQIDRSIDDPLRRVRGAASGAGRIDAHAGRLPRGPRGQGVANGLQRAVNGGRGGSMAAMNQMNMNPMAMMDPTNQMAFMQAMEVQAAMMQQLFQNGAQLPNINNTRGRGGKFDSKRGGRGGRQQSHPNPQNGGDTGMDIDKPLTDTKHPFEVMCRFNLHCTNPECHFAHQSPANRRPNVAVDMSLTCPVGAACTNTKCLARHPSPAQKQAYNKSEVPCKFYPHCTAGTSCPFKHPDTRPCRNGADCKVDGCPFAHSAIECRYTPCTRPDCPFRHKEGQRGRYKDRVWTPGGGEPNPEQQNGGGGTMQRFSELQDVDESQEELIKPAGGAQEGEVANGNANGNGNGVEAAMAEDVVT